MSQNKDKVSSNQKKVESTYKITVPRDSGKSPRLI